MSSRRARKPFVKIDCTTLGENLLESELFGHERGAFTGAIAQKRGRLELGDGGTVFLDEVGELAPALQAKLLRVLQDREFERVGGTRPIPVDVRFVAATHRDLREAVKLGGFRQDLFYRLHVLALQLPPLRERPEDIPLLARHFTREFGRRLKRRVEGISPGAMALLERYSWPGNVRELQNAIERALVLGSAEQILPEDLPETLHESAVPGAPPASDYYAVLQETKRSLIRGALERAQGSVTEAARLLGIHPNSLHRLMRNLSDLER
jgi:transcriptional regulator with GAF, ATPase, and Fis domain